MEDEHDLTRSYLWSIALAVVFLSVWSWFVRFLPFYMVVGLSIVAVVIRFKLKVGDADLMIPTYVVGTVVTDPGSPYVGRDPNGSPSYMIASFETDGDWYIGSRAMARLLDKTVELVKGEDVVGVRGFNVSHLINPGDQENELWQKIQRVTVGCRIVALGNIAIRGRKMQFQTTEIKIISWPTDDGLAPVVRNLPTKLDFDDFALPAKPAPKAA